MFSIIIKNERLKKNLSQKELGNILNVTQQAIGRWEKGLAKPDTSTLEKLADYFNVSIDYLLDRNNSKLNSPANEQNDIYIKEFENLTEEQKNNVLQYIRFLKTQNKN